MPWARIGEHVGQRKFAVTANAYTHVLVDEGVERIDPREEELGPLDALLGSLIAAGAKGVSPGR